MATCIAPARLEDRQQPRRPLSHASNRRLKVAFVTTRADAPGGSHVHLRDLSAAVKEHGHEVTIFVGGEGEFTNELAERGIPFHSLRHLVRPIRPVKDWRALLELRAALKRLQPDLVHAHSSKAGWVGRLAAWSLGIPALFTAHGFAFSEGVPARAARIYRCAERLAAPFADCIIAVSHYDRNLALRHGVARGERLVTVHNGIEDVDRKLRAEPERPVPRLVMVARFAEPKDHRLLLQALARLQDAQWTLDLIGDGPLRARTEALAASLGLTGRVRFLGIRKDVAACLAQSQIFVLTSKYEGLPLTILEAMRAGLPVVASAVGGVPEMVANGETGFGVLRGDAEMLRARLAQLIANPALRVRLGMAARALYQSCFTFDRMLSQTLKIYYDVIGGAHLRTTPASQPAPHPTPAVAAPAASAAHR
jgi:glycosyltransferase involved in cell wall biosynthesis